MGTLKVFVEERGFVPLGGHTQISGPCSPSPLGSAPGTAQKPQTAALGSVWALPHRDAGFDLGLVQAWHPQLSQTEMLGLILTWHPQLSHTEMLGLVWV